MYDAPIAVRLLDQIAAGEPAHLALADWLAGQAGEVERAHGELIVRQCGVGARDAAREAELQTIVREAHWKAPLLATDRVLWDRGFLDEVTLNDVQPRRPNQSFHLATLMALLFRSKLRRFVRAVGMYSQDPSAISEMGGVLADNLRRDRGAVRRMSFGEMVPAPGEMMRGTAIYGTLSIWDLGMREIAIRGATFEPGVIHAPGLRAFSFEGALDEASLGSLEAARWPDLEALSLGIGAYRSGTYVEDVRMDGASLAVLLERAEWMGQLRSLDLTYCDLRDGDVERFQHRLSPDVALDLSGNRLSRECREQLAERWPTMVCDDA